MAKTIRDGYYLTSSPADGIHSKAGMLRGVLICSSSGSNPGIVTFYDNTTATGTILAQIYTGQGLNPFYVQFPRDHCPRFSTGLSATFSNATVSVWSVDFG